MATEPWALQLKVYVGKRSHRTLGSSSLESQASVNPGKILRFSQAKRTAIINEVCQNGTLRQNAFGMNRLEAGLNDTGG